MCVNYGGRAEMLDAAVAIAKDAVKKKIKPDSLSEKSLNKYLYAPQMLKMCISDYPYHLSSPSTTVLCSRPLDFLHYNSQ